jgi:hypothetical protein
MVARTPRFLLGFSAVLSVVGGTMHALAFQNALVVIDASSLPRFYAGSAKGLWLADSAILFILAGSFALIAAKPVTATRLPLIALSFVPAATAAMLYTFLGTFYAGHLLLVIAALAFIAALRFPMLAAATRQV